jgi:hypothetical protein
VSRHSPLACERALNAPPSCDETVTRPRAHHCKSMHLHHPPHVRQLFPKVYPKQSGCTAGLLPSGSSACTPRAMRACIFYIQPDPCDCTLRPRGILSAETNFNSTLTSNTTLFTSQAENHPSWRKKLRCDPTSPTRPPPSLPLATPRYPLGPRYPSLPLATPSLPLATPRYPSHYTLHLAPSCI